MRRRHLLALAGATAGGAVFPAHAQKSAMPRVGFLVAGDAEPSWTLFRNAMADLGYVEGRTIAFEYRSSGTNYSRLDELAESLVRLQVKVIVAVLSQAIAAGKKATSTIPIVFNGAAPDTGTVTNLARPEGNLTGVFGSSATVAGKCIQLFHDIIPGSKTIGVLLNVPDPFHAPLLREIETASRAERMEIVPVMIKTPDELPAAFDALASRRVDGVMIQPSLGLNVTAALALKHRLPSVSIRREFAAAGGLLAYGASQADITRTVAGYVDKVLKGSRPADLPVQQATRFELIVNQKTAKALGLVLTPMFLARADEVIE
jgi:putative ABC transport system substrate-binding protein